MTKTSERILAIVINVAGLSAIILLLDGYNPWDGLVLTRFWLVLIFIRFMLRSKLLLRNLKVYCQGLFITETLLGVSLKS